jgi:lipopolysaccharide biosynthesis glycosyltransferase
MLNKLPSEGSYLLWEIRRRNGMGTPSPGVSVRGTHTSIAGQAVVANAGRNSSTLTSKIARFRICSAPLVKGPYALKSIVLTADENYLRYIPGLFAQISRFGQRSDGVTLAVPAGISDDYLKPVKAAASIHDIALTVAPVSESDYEQITRFTPIRYGKRPSHFTYARLLLPDMLPDLDEVLYLDVDTMIRAPIDQLLEWDLRHPVGAVPDLAGVGTHLFGTPGAPYFNAGVLLMSLERMRSEKVWEQSLRILETRTEVRLFDQDVLNLVFHDRFDSLPLTYNVSDLIIRRYPGLTALEDPVIVHFNGPVKPWHPSAKSRYAREWRRRYSQATFAAHFSSSPPSDHDPLIDNGAQQFRAYRHARRQGYGQLDSLARAVLPPAAKQAAKTAATGVVDRAMCRLEQIRTGLHPPQLPQMEIASSRTAISRPGEYHGDENTDSGLDLMVSVPRSGTNALGDVIQQSRPNVYWMNELFLGAEWSNLADSEIVERFPWFSNGGHVLPRAERHRAFESFAAKVSEQVVELTGAILENRAGRTLVKVFPDQLHPSAFEELLRIFRPRLLVLRRESVFTYVSRLRAIRLDERDRRYGKNFLGSDLTDAPFTLEDRAALQYAVRCDSWFDRVDQLAGNLGLTNVWLTYSGLFDTGADIPLLESFYPGPALPTSSDSRGLQSSLKIQDRRSDTSALGMIKAVSSLSAATQAHLLRLPGRYVKCQ